MSDPMKKKKRRKPSPVENSRDLRGRERSQKEERMVPNAPQAPDGVSGNWK